MQRHPTHNHLNAPIHPTELTKDGDFGGVHNRKTRRARAAVEKANARRAARRRARSGQVAPVDPGTQVATVYPGLGPGVLYEVGADGQIGAPVARVGLAGKYVDGQLKVESVGLFPLDTSPPVAHGAEVVVGADFRLDAIDDSTTFTGGTASTVVAEDR